LTDGDFANELAGAFFSNAVLDLVGLKYVAGDTTATADGDVLLVTAAGGTDAFKLSGPPAGALETAPDSAGTGTLVSLASGGAPLEAPDLLSLLDLSFATYTGATAGFASSAGYVPFESTADAGFAATACFNTNDNATDCERNIVIAFRGTYLGSLAAAIKNILADSSFLLGTPNALLQRYVADAASFVRSVYDEATAQGIVPVITLTGHSLGGALAQLVSEASGLPAFVFDAPGAQQVYPNLTAELAPVVGLGHGAGSTNYRISGDQVSEAGTQIGDTITLASPYTPAGSSVIQVVANVANNHGVGMDPTPPPSPYRSGYEYAFQNLDDPAMQSAGVTGPNLLPIFGGLINALSFILPVLAGAAVTIDPQSGTAFVLTGDAGSPDFSSVALPFEPDVASYDLAYEVDGSFSAFEQVAAGVQTALPAGVTGIEFDPLDASSHPVEIAGGFFFDATFATSGTFTGTLTETGEQLVGLPVTTPATLIAAPGAAAAPIGILAPSDAAYPDPNQLVVTVEALPTDGSVFLPDGSAPATLDEELTTAQLAGLTFAPKPGVSGAVSTFGYTVTDPDLSSTSGLATLEVACFAQGTRISTDRGERRVETLRSGDRVATVTPFGWVSREIVWVGSRRIDLAAHPRRELVDPVRVAAGGFGPRSPSRDLVLSPDHAVFVRGVLVPVRMLVNGATIRQERRRRVTYWHVELAEHAVLLAEGLPVESYLDTGNRGQFAAAAASPHADLWPPAGRPTRACARLATDAATVEPIWRRLAARAAALGCDAPPRETIGDAGLRVVAADRTLHPLSAAGGRRCFALPPGVPAIRIRSRAAAPSEARPWLDDRRRLGVSVSRILVRDDRSAQEIPLDSPDLTDGWHPAERRGSHPFRWTDGDALVRLPESGGPTILEIVADSGGMTYPAATLGDVT
jgi:hypothetical protein